jgi:hypothetical protein
MITTTQLLAFFNLFVGIMLVSSILLFCGGFVVYLVRLGTWPTYREEAVNIMMWGLSILFTLVMLLGLQQFLLSHQTVAVTIGALILIAILIWALSAGSGGGEKKKGDAH